MRVRHTALDTRAVTGMPVNPDTNAILRETGGESAKERVGAKRYGSVRRNVGVTNDDAGGRRLRKGDWAAGSVCGFIAQLAQWPRQPDIGACGQGVARPVYIS